MWALHFWGLQGLAMQGQTWEELVHVIKPAAKLVSKWLIENAIVQYRNNRTGVSGLLQVFRDDTGNVWQSRSLNDGRNWTDALPGPLISPDSKAKNFATFVLKNMMLWCKMQTQAAASIVTGRCRGGPTLSKCVISGP